MALSDEQIYDIVTDWFADPWVIAPAIKMIKQAESEVRKHDEALIRQMLEALEVLTQGYDDSAVGLEIEAITAGRAWLEGKP